MKRSRALEKVGRIAGWSVTRTGGNHWKICGPGVLVYTGSTPSDRRARSNLIAQLRREGAPDEVLDVLRSA